VTQPTSNPHATFEVSDLNRVRRYAKRASYDRDTVFAILDSALVAHVAFVHDERPVVIPMIFGHDGERIFLHGARKGRITTATAGEPVSISVALVDGIVAARSLFDSSMNYRAVVIHGRATVLTSDEDRVRALRCITDHSIPGRWDEVRLPTEIELRATEILAVEIEGASAKVRDAGVIEEDEPASADVWCGVIPVATTLGQPIADPKVPESVPIPPSVVRLTKSR
jgi:nitroimidazol reductase NimA-like FMN-containing flavoprotein (pyridoxamine 5'-phosphate oxidase superfamily)